MADKANYTNQFVSECNEITPHVDTHEEAAAEGQQPALPRDQTGPPRVNSAERQPTAVHQSGPRPVEAAREDTRMPIPGQPPPLVANDRRSGNGEAPASLELSCPLVDNDTGSPASVRGPLANDSSANTVRKRPPSPAHGTSGHTSQADDTSNELPLTSSDTDEEQTYRRHSDDDLEHPDDEEHDGPRKQKKRHVLKNKMPKMRKRPRVETGAQADT